SHTPSRIVRWLRSAAPTARRVSKPPPQASGDGGFETRIAARCAPQPPEERTAADLEDAQLRRCDSVCESLASGLAGAHRRRRYAGACVAGSERLPRRAESVLRT